MDRCLICEKIPPEGRFYMKCCSKMRARCVLCHNCAQSTKFRDIETCKVGAHQKYWIEMPPLKSQVKHSRDRNDFETCTCLNVSHNIFCQNCGKCKNKFIKHSQCCNTDICNMCSSSLNGRDIAHCFRCGKPKKWHEMTVGVNSILRVISPASVVKVM